MIDSNSSGALPNCRLAADTISRSRSGACGRESHAFLGLFLIALLTLAPPASGAELLTNGDFESPTLDWSFAGIVWFGLDGGIDAGITRHGAGGWLTYERDDFGPWYDRPAGIEIAGGDRMQTFYPDVTVLGLLYQPFTVPTVGAAVSLSFDYYTAAGPADYGVCQLDYVCADSDGIFPDSLFRVDVLRAGADLYSTTLADSRAILDGTDDSTFPPVPLPYLHVDQDISNFVAGGGDYILRFAALGSAISHVDNVSIDYSVPEPSTGLLLVGGLLLAMHRQRAEET